MGSHSFLHYPAAQPTEIHLWWLFRAHAVHHGFEVVFSAAVRSSSMALARNLLSDRLREQQFDLQREQAIPLSDCLIDADLALAAAARQQQRDCLIGPMGMASVRDAAAHLAHLPAPEIEVLANIQPWPPRGAPDDAPAMPAVVDTIFFDRPGRELGLDDAVYAVIDGAKVFGLAERLSGSGLRHACLFQGKAETDWGDVSPWLVELGRHHRITRQLFTQQKEDSQTPCLWKSGAAIFLRSPLGFEGMRAHLRHFTMAIDQTRNTRMYFRFYDPLTVRTIFPHMPIKQLERMMTGVTCVLGCDPKGSGTLIRNMLQAA